MICATGRGREAQGQRGVPIQEDQDETEIWQQKTYANRSYFQEEQMKLFLSFASALAPRNKGDYTCQNLQNFKSRPAQSQGCVEQGGNQTPACARCGRTHPRKCRQDQKGFFKYGQEGHFIRECLKNMQGNGIGGEQTVYMLQKVPKRKRILQMLSVVYSSL